MTARRLVRVLAPNPGPFTLRGTNTWIVGERPALVIDPGPPDAGHADEIRRSAPTVAAILLTHRHDDHASGAGILAALVRAPVMAFEGAERRLSDGDLIHAGGGVTLRAVHTPGHTPDHMCFFDEAAGALFTGDTVLGRGTSVIDPPDGDMREYVASLQRLRELRPRVLYPGHGPAVWDADGKLAEYLDHRAAREQQVLDALAARGPSRAERLVPAIYPDHPPEVHPAAARSVLAHLLDLERRGLVRRAGPPEDETFTVEPPRRGGRSRRG